MAEALRCEYHGVEIELVEIFGRLFLQRDVRIAVLRRHEACMVAARGVGAEIAAAMRGNDLEPGEAIERSLEDQVLQGDRGVERIADGVRQPAIALETLGEFRCALRMDEQYRAEFFRLGPDGMEFRIGKILP